MLSIRRSASAGRANAGTPESSFRRTVQQLSSPDIVVDCRAIRPGDEFGLLPNESRSIGTQVVEARRASGAVRVLGREMLARLGHDACAIPKSASGAPIWPAGIVGTFAHDDEFAVAAVARSSDIGMVGIDVEPARELPIDLRELVLTPGERARIGEDPCRGRLFFAAKEAVYKAVAAFDGTHLDYQDIDVDVTTGQAVLMDGRTLRLRQCMATHVVVLAFVPQQQARPDMPQTTASRK